MAETAEDRVRFCEELAPALTDAMEILGIEDADMSDGRALADVVYCAGYRLAAPVPHPAATDPSDGGA